MCAEKLRALLAPLDNEDKLKQAVRVATPSNMLEELDSSSATLATAIEIALAAGQACVEEKNLSDDVRAMISRLNEKFGGSLVALTAKQLLQQFPPVPKRRLSVGEFLKAKPGASDPHP